jgi:hypothetical protein
MSWGYGDDELDRRKREETEQAFREQNMMGAPEHVVRCACPTPVTRILKGNEHLKGKCQKCLCKLRAGYFNHYEVPFAFRARPQSDH